MLELSGARHEALAIEVVAKLPDEVRRREPALAQALYLMKRGLEVDGEQVGCDAVELEVSEDGIDAFKISRGVLLTGPVSLIVTQQRPDPDLQPCASHLTEQMRERVEVRIGVHGKDRVQRPPREQVQRRPLRCARVVQMPAPHSQHVTFLICSGHLDNHCTRLFFARRDGYHNPWFGGHPHCIFSRDEEMF